MFRFSWMECVWVKAAFIWRIFVFVILTNILTLSQEVISWCLGFLKLPFFGGGAGGWLGGGMPSERSFCVSVCLSMCLSVYLSARHLRDGVIPFLFSCRGKEVLPVWPVLLFLYWERQQQVGRMKLFNGMEWWRLTWSGLKLVKEINNIFNFINRKLITITFSEVVCWLGTPVCMAKLDSDVASENRRELW